jgi:hypothetical protein
MFFKVEFVLFSNGNLMLWNIQCVHPSLLKKLLVFILFINIPKCGIWTLFDYYKMSSKVCMKNYYRGDLIYI